MKAVFRADASAWMGIGHVMRCLALANTMSESGWECQFVCRTLEGDEIERIQNAGFPVIGLEHVNIQESVDMPQWRASTQQQDAQETLSSFVDSDVIDLLVVDHYGLDTDWERQLRPMVKKVLVIDDLADRNHDCDLLLDQNFGRDRSDYTTLVPEECGLLVGPKFALLRDEFVETRQQALARRAGFDGVKNVLIALGGGDQRAVLKGILQKIGTISLPNPWTFTVVGGFKSDEASAIQLIGEEEGLTLETIPFSNEMASLMVSSDVAIAGGGSGSWERCCLGLPSLSILVAENQVEAGRRLMQHGAVFDALPIESLTAERLGELLNLDTINYKAISDRAAALCDGLGCQRVLESLINE